MGIYSELYSIIALSIVFSAKNDYTSLQTLSVKGEIVQDANRGNHYRVYKRKHTDFDGYSWCQNTVSN